MCRCRLSNPKHYKDSTFACGPSAQIQVTLPILNFEQSIICSFGLMAEMVRIAGLRIPLSRRLNWTTWHNQGTTRARQSLRITRDQICDNGIFGLARSCYFVRFVVPVFDQLIDPLT